MLEIGSTPDIRFEDTDGNRVSLTDFAGKQNVLIYFMRALSCAQCNAHVQSFAKNQSEFDNARVEIIVAVPEDLKDAAAWKARKNIPYTVVAGAEGTPHESVGLLRKVFGTLQQSGSVLLDSKGVVRYTEVSTVPTTSYNRRELGAALAALAPIG
ncbi:MAG TPA: redoxin domain-containing protein [Galbitalea sp.]|jgi:peroxiredoxin